MPSTIITKANVQQLIQKTTIIDVREPDEFQQGSVPSSFNISVSQLEEALLTTPTEFETTYGFKKPSKEDEIVLYCRSGRRSAKAALVAENLGYGNIKDYSGGWMDWSS